MSQLKTKSDYTKQVQAALDKAGPERTGLSTRLNKQFKNLVSKILVFIQPQIT